MPDGLPRCLLLVDVASDDGWVVVHQIAGKGVSGGAQQHLGGDQPDQPPLVRRPSAHCDVGDG